MQRKDIIPFKRSNGRDPASVPSFVDKKKQIAIGQRWRARSSEYTDLSWVFRILAHVTVSRWDINAQQYLPGGAWIAVKEGYIAESTSVFVFDDNGLEVSDISEFGVYGLVKKLRPIVGKRHYRHHAAYDLTVYTDWVDDSNDD